MIDYPFYPTDSHLSEYIFSYGVAKIAKGTTSPLLSLPNGLTGFIIKIKSNNKAKLIAQDFEGNAIANQHSYAIGQTTFPITGYAISQLTLLVVFFQPLGMYQLFVKKNGCVNK